MKTERMSVEEYRKALEEEEKKKPKYHNNKIVIDGIKFDSEKESTRYSELKILEKLGDIEDLKLQVPFELIPSQPDEKAVKYIADFVYIEDGRTVVEDTKGFKTKDYIIKRKLMKWLHPVVFREVVE